MCEDYLTQAVCFLLLLAAASPAGHPVRIRELRVPAIIRLGSSALLDCDYTLEGVDHLGLVVKWYFNDPTQSRPVYQWIPGATGPQGLGPLRGKLNLGYRASQDARTWHRALHIPEPQAEMSGEYTCVVSTFEGEDRQTKRMLVFDSHLGLVVKWYFNDPTQSRPVYQWIPGATGPQGLGPLRGKLNLGYRASQDARTWHRALHIPEPQAEMSGEYTCVVSTFEGEDRQTKRMLVFVPERSLRLRHTTSSDGSPLVVCSAEGVYPQPELSVRLASEELEATTVVRREHDGLFDVSAVARMPEVTEVGVVECELRVREANYTVRRESVWYPGTSSRASFPVWPRMWMALVTLQLLSPA